MRHYTAALAVLFPLTLSVAKADPILYAYDTSPLDEQCTPGQVRHCYVPSPTGWGPTNPNVGGPGGTHNFVQFTLTQATWIEATYDAAYFLPPGAAYGPGIGVDGFDAAHLCQARNGEDQFEGITVNDSTINQSHATRAICVIQLAPGPHAIYAMEYARPGAVASRGSPSQALIVRFLGQ